MEERKLRRLNAKQWAEMMERFDGEGNTSVTDFCRREGVSKSAFHRQRAQLRKPPPQPVMKPHQAVPLASKPRFVDLGEIEKPSQAGSLEIRLDLGGGVTLSLIRR